LMRRLRRVRLLIFASEKHLSRASVMEGGAYQRTVPAPVADDKCYGPLDATLWFFGDSFIGVPSATNRRDAAFVNVVPTKRPPPKMP
jgi:hypothetical protein